MSAPTLIFIRHATIDGRQYHHGDELPPDVLTAEQIAQGLDNKVLVEYDSAERRSLYRLLPRFSGAKERELLTKEELTAYTLQP
jgi:hypothetical protein